MKNNTSITMRIDSTILEKIKNEARTESLETKYDIKHTDLIRKEIYEKWGNPKQFEKEEKESGLDEIPEEFEREMDKHGEISSLNEITF